VGRVVEKKIRNSFSSYWSGGKWERLPTKECIADRGWMSDSPRTISEPTNSARYKYDSVLLWSRRITNRTGALRMKKEFSGADQKSLLYEEKWPSVSAALVSIRKNRVMPPVGNYFLALRNGYNPSWGRKKNNGKRLTTKFINSWPWDFQ